MKSRYLFTLSIAVALALQVQGQMPRNSVGFTMGIDLVSLLDQNTSVLPYQGRFYRAGFNWQHNGPKWHADLRISGGLGRLNAEGHRGRSVRFLDEDIHGERDSVDVPVFTNAYPLRLSYSFLRRFGPPDAVWRPAVGARLSDDMLYSSGFLRPGMMKAVALSPQVQMDYQPSSRLAISVGVSVPVVALVTRLPYHNSVSKPGGSTVGGFFDGNTAFRTPAEYRQISAFMALYHRINDRWMAGLRYEFDRRTDTLPKKLYQQQHSLAATIQFIY